MGTAEGPGGLIWKLSLQCNIFSNSLGVPFTPPFFIYLPGSDHGINHGHLGMDISFEMLQ